MNERAIVTALRDFDYNGRPIPRGSKLWMPDLDAALHINLQNVSGDPYPGIPDPEPEAEPDAEPEADPTPEPDPEPALVIPPRRKRSYRRRDLTAEPK